MYQKLTITKESLCLPVTYQSRKINSANRVKVKAGSVTIYFNLAIVLVILVACREQVESPDDNIALLKLETLPSVVQPNNNPTTETKQILGKYLFYDPILSGEKDVACGTCHLPNHGYADGIDLSIGVGGKGLSVDRKDYSNGRIPVVGRNAQSVINTAFNGMISRAQNYDPLLAIMFWDGRKKSLESQCLGPPTAYSEMRGDEYGATVTYDSIVARLERIPEYDSLFTVSFGAPNSIVIENISKAIAAFERTIISTNSSYDLYVKGDRNALSPVQKSGLLLFYGKANCATCHSGPMFSDCNFYTLGIEDNPKRADQDKGSENKFKFRTPSLRNIALTAPYMHNGMLPTLESVMSHYIHAVSNNPDIPSIDPKIRPLNLTAEEVNAIIEFLNALTDDSYDQQMLTRVPSGLKPAGD